MRISYCKGEKEYIQHFYDTCIGNKQLETEEVEGSTNVRLSLTYLGAKMGRRGTGS